MDPEAVGLGSIEQGKRSGSKMPRRVVWVTTGLGMLFPLKGNWFFQTPTATATPFAIRPFAVHKFCK